MFGVSTFCLHHEPLDTALDAISGITDCVEIMDDGLHHIEATEPLESYNLTYFIHAPARGVNIASLLEPIRRASVEVLVQCFSIAGELGADVVIHPGYYAWREERERAKRSFHQSIAELSLAAEERSVTYYIENMGNWEYFFLRFADELPLPGGIGLALDVGHAHLNGCLEAFLAVPFAHIHLHDNSGRGDSHSTVGTGNIDFRPVMEAVRRNKVIPIVEVETFEGTVESIRVLEAM
ncbi:MAG: sugar phosphate isomerase/epimerase [Methanomicrobiaceae archaeon]|uniref:Xylose isomerase-like TIM barrel domain-containing protein n=1 Tax=hydrocarbon metagenome TaxID=938273 RepID=A0A0W8FFH6_9ZZZZ|nr:sugar phosphate isomerase/epimerase [Methanomicrobiaceae archaeon]MDD5419740.1 sugar phosphate isomerase/epimerase [Methanomicrobiaceae archaeon]